MDNEVDSLLSELIDNKIIDDFDERDLAITASIKTSSNPINLKPKKFDFQSRENSFVQPSTQSEKGSQRFRKLNGEDLSETQTRRTKRKDCKANSIAVDNAIKMENEVDEEIYKILHTNFDSIQKDDDEVKSNKIAVISESRNSKSIQMNPNKYSETRMLEDMILHEVDMLELKDNTCSTESTSSKALDSETAKTDYSKKCINPYSSERFGDLSLFRPSQGAEICINPSILNFDNRLSAICKCDIKEKKLTKFKKGQKIRLVRHYKDELFYVVSQANGYFGEIAQVCKISLNNFNIFNNSNPKGKRYYRILEWEDFKLDTNLKSDDKWNDSDEIACKAKDKLSCKVLVFVNEDIKRDYRFEEIGVNQLIAK